MMLFTRMQQELYDATRRAHDNDAAFPTRRSKNTGLTFLLQKK